VGDSDLYAYDANGNMTYRFRDGQELELTYDDAGRLIYIDGSVDAEFTYDGDGQRVASFINGVTTVYVGNVYEEVNGNPAYYYYAGGKRVAVRRNGQLYWLLHDHLGSTQLTINDATDDAADLRYRAYGELRYVSGDPQTTYRFTGQRYDEATGLYYYGARYYDPHLGRFIQPDSAYSSPTSNRYTYALNNPVRYTDPTGRYPYEDPDPVSFWDRVRDWASGVIVPTVGFLWNAYQYIAERAEEWGVDMPTALRMLGESHHLRQFLIRWGMGYGDLYLPQSQLWRSIATHDIEFMWVPERVLMASQWQLTTWAQNFVRAGWRPADSMRIPVQGMPGQYAQLWCRRIAGMDHLLSPLEYAERVRQAYQATFGVTDPTKLAGPERWHTSIRFLRQQINRLWEGAHTPAQQQELKRALEERVDMCKKAIKQWWAAIGWQVPKRGSILVVPHPCAPCASPEFYMQYPGLCIICPAPAGDWPGT